MSSKTKTKRSRRIASILMALILSLCMLASAVTQTSAVTTASDKVDQVKNSILQVVMLYQAPNSDKVVWSTGTCFLINPTTAISCAHIFEPSINPDLAAAIAAAYGADHVFDKKYVKDCQILVNGGVPVKADLKKENLKADYSVIKLDENVNRPTVTLGYSKDAKVTQQIYTLGFPSTVSDLQDSKTYTTDQVTITGSTISNISTTNGVDYITHNANISNGNSGGPLVDENGRVIGINLYKTNDDYFLAAAIDQVAALLDDLGYEYTRSDGPTPEPATEDRTEETTVAPATQATTMAPLTTAPAVEQPKDGDMTKTIIIIAIAVLAVIIIAVVIVIIVLNSKKKKTPPAGPEQRKMPPNTPPYNPTGNGPRPQSYPGQQQFTPPQQHTPTVPTSEGAGETSVLNDGAGETTVLGAGGQGVSFQLLRKRNGEKITINKPEFTIGKERRRVDYCISDNNSISRVHAKIRVRAGRCYITDMNSTNCTYVNGTKISPNQEVILSPRDKIKISDEEFEFIG